ncbi:acyl-CoA dehydrogenase family protein [Luteimonas sp. SX5]|uniref:Acyl-CoA dehydrogenase family protein n=1 Tax=Luteimonas galliterrae TaxID=2940486 RepID=A0ABT0MGI1_9GAMM|nr:acyl-CoA dehydrogenase family protein [Luteimonas galliterrae]MCL1633992.1 acyl-CoA dehydrogenase family protein [Luteimonas galliterrae]
MSRFQTHVVDNQPPEFAPCDLWAADCALREAVAREGGGAFEGRLAAYGALAGDELYRLSFDAHRDKPRLRTHDRFGHRIDTVEFHPNYHRILQAALENGVAGLSWSEPVPGSHVARAALSYLHHQVEPGTSCPLTMTHAAMPVLRHAPALREWADKVAASQYDPRDVPIGQKAGVTLGMGMTEKQGGSDVRANTTLATPLAEEGKYSLIGHKWFFSAPMCDGFLVLAQAPGGLTCFLMPRRLADGAKNAFRLMRLKDKLGDWSNASGEVEFVEAKAYRIGDEGRGIATILEMVMLTRLDCMLGSAAEMRMALAQALHHAAHRIAFGKRLIEQPLMRNVLADLAVESEAALALSMRVARAVDSAPRDAREAAFARVATAIGKYWICKRAPAFVNEAQECLGGAGYVEESILPRLYRQAPLNSIWEGSGNIQCLDVLRALSREPETGEALLAELDGAVGLHPALDAAAASLRVSFADAKNAEAGARLLVERMALALQAAVLLRAGSPVADAFCRSRLGGEHGLALGTLPVDADFAEIIDRARAG